MICTKATHFNIKRIFYFKVSSFYRYNVAKDLIKLFIKIVTLKRFSLPLFYQFKCIFNSMGLQKLLIFY